FLTYVLFSRSRPEQALRHLQIVCWMGALAAGITMLAPSFAADGRLDSFLWGRSNAFAAALILTISAGLIGILAYKRYLLILPILVSLAGVVLTQSRGSLLILLGMSVLILVARSRNPLQGLGSLVLVGGVATLILFATPPRLWDAVPVVNRLTPQVESLRGYLHDGNEYDKRELLSGRLYIWESALNQIEASPWVGNSVREIYMPRWPGSAVLLVEEEQMSYHSWALNIAAASGLLVLALNVLVLLLALAPYWAERSPVRRMVLVVLLAQVAYGLTEPMFEGGFFALNIIGMLTWILAGIGIALPQSAPTPKHPRVVR
ncbi:MAG: O-antigen ligase family protein, partial [Caldilineaceae bacterium]